MKFLKLLAALGLAVGLAMPPAQAETISDPLKNFMPTANAKAPWSGFYVGAGVGRTVAELSGGGPIGLSSNAMVLTPIVGVDYQVGSIVAGVALSYSHLFGDLDTIGIKSELAVTGRLGTVLGTNGLLYGHLSWARLDTQFGDIDGWKIGPGFEYRVPDTQWSVDFRYSYDTWDVKDFAPGIRANSQEGMIFAKYRFK